MTAIVPFLMGSRQLKIVLEEPVIYLHGPSTSTRTHVLRGIVVLSLSRPLSATSVDIKFVCKSRTDWPEGIGPRKTKMLHDQVILELQKTLYKMDATPAGSLPAGTHRWLFEFSLPYSMVETVQDDSARVLHYLSATVRRPGPSSVNLKQRHDVLVLRIVQPDGDEDDDEDEGDDNDGSSGRSTRVGNNMDTPTFAKQIACADVGIRLGTSVIVAGSQLLLDITLTPHIKGVWLECISVVLQEHKTYRVPTYNACRSEAVNAKVNLASATSSTDPELQDVTLAQLHHAINAKNAHIPLMTDSFAYQLMLKVPTCHLVHHSTTWRELEFRHRIHVRIELTVPDSKDRAVAVFKIPITVLDCRLKGGDFGLPAYEHAVTDDIAAGGTAQGTETPSSPSIAIERDAKACCSCYTKFQKRLRTNRKKHLMFRHQQQAMLPPPPAYEPIQTSR